MSKSGMAAAALALVSITGTVAAVPAGATRPPRPARITRVCAPRTDLGAACRALTASVDGVHPLATTTPAPTSLTPADLASAYALPDPRGAQWKWNRRTIVIVDAMDNPSAADDLSAYRAQFGLPPCTVASGCFAKLSQNGRKSPLPAGDVSWGREIDLDLQIASAVCPLCRIRLVEASSTSVVDLAAAENEGARLNASAISNSWGSQGESLLAALLFDSAFDHKGIAITAATGDAGYGGSWPADNPNVIAVGGTSLQRDTSARGWSESAWSGAGSWCSDFEAQPSWQAAAIQAAATAGHTARCTNRSAADVAAVADPHTGVAVYDSYGSTGGANWYQFGGTSVSTPIIASIYALAGDQVRVRAIPRPALATYNAWYADPSVLNDVTSGSNGNCGTDPAYMCNGAVGYDGPTGLGTPNGLRAF